VRPAIGVAQAHPARGRIGLGQARPVARPGAGPAPAPVAAAPAAAPPAGAPWDAQAERESGAGLQAYGDKYSGLEGDWKSRKEWYGLGETNNPYSQASLLSHRHEVDNRAVLNSAGNHLYAGSTVNAHQSADRRFSVGLESLKAAYAAEEARKTREEEAAKHEWEREQGEIAEGALTRAAEREPPPAPEPEPAPAPAPAPGSGPGKGRRGRGINQNRRAR
jgi:hypothetical protein